MYSFSCITKYNNLILLITFFSFTFCSSTIDDLKKSYCFFKDYVKKTNSLGNNFDYITCHSFLKTIPETSSFSPICGEINFHLQMIHEEYGPDYVDCSKTKLNELMTNIRKSDDKNLNSANRVYMIEGDTTRTDPDPLNNYVFERYNESNIDYKLINFKLWIKEVTKDMIDMNLDRTSFKIKSRIYISTITFKEDWAESFDVKYTKSDVFNLSNGKTTKRKYMNKEDYFRYGNLNMGGINFQMVVVPYKHQTRRHVPSRVMVYLIPEDSNTKKIDLWNSFYLYSKTKGIKEAIIGSETKYLDLYFPKVEKLYSQFDVIDIFSDIFGDNTSYSCRSNMSTYINIDEKGTEAAACMYTDCVDGIVHLPKPKTVKADVPHIAFIYDLDLQRILFILNDNGLV